MSIARILSTVKRIRWGSVIALALLVVFFFTFLGSFPSGYEVGGQVGLKVVAKPEKIHPGGSTVLEIELKNLNPEATVDVVVEGQTHDNNLIFEESYTQTYRSASIKVGPQGVRKTSFRVKTKPGTLEGRYRIDVLAKDQLSDGRADSRVFVDVETK